MNARSAQIALSRDCSACEEHSDVPEVHYELKLSHVLANLARSHDVQRIWCLCRTHQHILPLSKFVDALHIVRSGFPCVVTYVFPREVWHSLGVLVLCNCYVRTQ